MTHDHVVGGNIGPGEGGIVPFQRYIKIAAVVDFKNRLTGLDGRIDGGVSVCLHRTNVP